MAHLLRLITFSLLVTVAAPFSPALAAPYTYEFVSGGLTGTWTTEPPNPAAGQWNMLSFHITTPLGDVYQSQNPGNDPNLFISVAGNIGAGNGLQAEFRSSIGRSLGFGTDGPTTLNPTQSSGTYGFETSKPDGLGGFLSARGEGEWKLVPIPDMLWPTLFGLVGLVLYMERRRRQEGRPI